MEMDYLTGDSSFPCCYQARLLPTSKFKYPDRFLGGKCCRLRRKKMNQTTTFPATLP